VKAILGDGERVSERERDERSEGVESEWEVRVKASFGGIVIGRIVVQGMSSSFFGRTAVVSRLRGEDGGGGEGCGGEYRGSGQQQVTNQKSNFAECRHVLM
jgi:hypothetical protein